MKRRENTTLTYLYIYKRAKQYQQQLKNKPLRWVGKYMCRKQILAQQNYGIHSFLANAYPCKIDSVYLNFGRQKKSNKTNATWKLQIVSSTLIMFSNICQCFFFSFYYFKCFYTSMENVVIWNLLFVINTLDEHWI